MKMLNGGIKNMRKEERNRMFIEKMLFMISGDSEIDKTLEFKMEKSEEFKSLEGLKVELVRTKAELIYCFTVGSGLRGYDSHASGELLVIADSRTINMEELEKNEAKFDSGRWLLLGILGTVKEIKGRGKHEVHAGDQFKLVDAGKNHDYGSLACVASELIIPCVELNNGTERQRVDLIALTTLKREEVSQCKNKVDILRMWSSISNNYGLTVYPDRDPVKMGELDIDNFFDMITEQW